MKLKMDGICKSFGSNEVLKSLGFQLSEGEICALLGEIFWAAFCSRIRARFCWTAKR